ncbi:MAG: ParB/RepB/Spo0J family partition protein [Alphaproteobacteria bacterium]|nr:ParB/RepB/Spo0J family partition protein [Alphaproteobacteria bacterium]
MSQNKRPSLGRGLSALLGESLPPMNDQIFGNVTTLPVSQLKPGQFQPRSVFDDEKLMSLIDSIREKGIIQPLVVRKLDLGRYEIIAGERRWRAAKTLNYVEVPVIIRECNDTEALELAIVENIQRDDLNPLEEAEAYQKLMTQFNYTQEQIAKQIGKSRSYVANMLRLNGLPGNIKSLIFEGKISAGHARALLTIENNDELVQEIVAKNLNVREVEKKVKELKSGGPTKATDSTRIPQEKSDDILSLENQLRGLLDSNVDIILKKDKGHITIHFNSLEQMDDIIQKIRSSMEGDY